MIPDERFQTPAARIDRMLRSESVVWMSTVNPDGTPHLVPIWFSWDGATVLIASKPHARKVANLRANPAVMLALGEPEEDFDVGMIQGVAELCDRAASELVPSSHFAKYRRQMAAIGLTREEFLATYSQVIRIRPTRFLPWHGRTAPANEMSSVPVDRRIREAVRRIAASTSSPRRMPVRAG